MVWRVGEKLGAAEAGTFRIGVGTALVPGDFSVGLAWRLPSAPLASGRSFSGVTRVPAGPTPPFSVVVVLCP